MALALLLVVMMVEFSESWVGGAFVLELFCCSWEVLLVLLAPPAVPPAVVLPVVVDEIEPRAPDVALNWGNKETSNTDMLC